ncbi:MAG: saccharopine dehydrogenase NADP-binding domain-containing protein [Bacteroidota bacterium]|nr:saccharopine dehydrogenase NADP-binding domain-containing protein [Bacteroidota bacterium]
MKHILLFGAGKSATVLIAYLQEIAVQKQWQVTIVDQDLAALQAKLNRHPLILPVGISIHDAKTRYGLIQQADVVISLLPPSLHILVAVDCLEARKSLLTASYVDDQMRSMSGAIKEANILFLCEMGLDPGIDHMSAMQLIHRIRNRQGRILSFVSHCGGLIAPESDNNPWHYKFSWNPRNVVLAGKAGAEYLEDSIVRQVPYEKLFTDCPKVRIPGLGTLAYYSNRDSLSYLPTYGLSDAHRFQRTTLRYPEFCSGWEKVVAAGLTDETVLLDTDALSVADFFQQAFARKGLQLDTPLLREQFGFLGWENPAPLGLGKVSSATILQHILEEKWKLLSGDRDMVVMMHELAYETDMGSGLPPVTRNVKSYLVVKGENALHTAMAKTVGLPLGIAATLFLEGRITETGLQIPILPGIYEPVLTGLQQHGIVFEESEEG